MELERRVSAIETHSKAIESRIQQLENAPKPIATLPTAEVKASTVQQLNPTVGAVAQQQTRATNAADGSRRPSGVESMPGVHVVVTSNGNRYMNWQTRVCYTTFQTQASKPGSQLKAFTRVLHRSSDDELMQEVPTVRIPTAHPDCDVWCSYPVADRGPALLAFFARPGAWMYQHVLIVETDYVFVAPITHALPAMGQGFAFPFGYIVPTYPTVKSIMNRHYDGPEADIPGTGNAPALLNVDDLAKIIPIWNQVTERLNNDKEAVDVLGWVREMYGYSIASAMAGVKYQMDPVPNNFLMVQPPADEALGKAAICHYTWGTILKDKSTGKELWRWDKREYAQGQYGDRPVVPMIQIPSMPPWSADLITQDGHPFSEGKHQLLQIMIAHFNDAVDQINQVNGGLPKGFSSLVEAAKVAQPSKEAWDARRRVEAEERRKKNQG